MLSIKDLHVSVEDKAILRGLSLDVRPGEVHAIMGPNGSGKSTLSATLAGREDYEVTGGTVEFKGKDLLPLNLRENLPLRHPVIPECGKLSRCKLRLRQSHT
ncbi:putative ATP-dependent transporter SufC domain protein, partial [Escherichia coli 97.1742]